MNGPGSSPVRSDHTTPHTDTSGGAFPVVETEVISGGHFRRARTKQSTFITGRMDDTAYTAHKPLAHHRTWIATAAAARGWHLGQWEEPGGIGSVHFGQRALKAAGARRCRPLLAAAMTSQASRIHVY